MPAPFRKLLMFVAGGSALGMLPGCGDGEDEFTVNVTGDYTVALTNRESTCDFPDWVEGESASGISLNIMQNGSELSGTVDGLAGVALALRLGSSEFEGSAKGSTLTLTNYGSIPARQGNCSFTYNATVRGTLRDNAISGTITYTPATNDNPDCASVECSAVQEFSGARPPKS
jgi:hypothetical protein